MRWAVWISPHPYTDYTYVLGRYRWRWWAWIMACHHADLCGGSVSAVECEPPLRRPGLEGSYRDAAL